MIDLIVSKALDDIEAIESVSLSWGIVDTKIFREELNVIIVDARDWVESKVDDSSTLTTDEIVAELSNRGLIRRYDSGQNVSSKKYYYRSRMAETVRLIFKLRQLFLLHMWRLRPESFCRMNILRAYQKPFILMVVYLF